MTKRRRVAGTVFGILVLGTVPIAAQWPAITDPKVFRQHVK